MERLRELRLYKGLTQQKVADSLGCNQSAVGKYERGELEPNIETLIKLARLFDVTVDYLTGNTDEFGAVTNNVDLSDAEKDLVFYFRNTTDAGKKAISDSAKSIYEALKVSPGVLKAN